MIGQQLGLAFDEIGTTQRRNTEVRLTHRWREMDSNLYGAFPVKSFFGLLSVLCSERESGSSSRRLRSGLRSARKGSRDRNGSKA